ncbi:MAG: DUF1428 domain-containing protein [Pseudomonadota bacterium]
MSYVDGFVAAVPNENKEKYIAHAKISALVLKENGALNVVETWENDVSQGEITSFPLAVQKKESESVIFSWVVWPSKTARDAGWKSYMEDPRMDPNKNPMPFDGKRLIYGGFTIIAEE